MTGDPVDDYLARLRRKLRGRDAELILAEAEDHLRETAATGMAIGMTQTEAAEAAVSAFGTVTAVIRAHRARTAGLAADLVLAAWKLAWTGLFAIAASGGVALAMNRLLGPAFVGRAAAGAAYPAAKCQYWLSAWPGAHTCARAAVLEISGDAVSLRVIGGGLAGAVLLAGYLAARLLRRRAGRYSAGHPARYAPGIGEYGLGRPAALLPLAAVAVFGAGALGLAVITITGSPIGVPSGPGFYLSGALVSVAVAAAYAPAARRALRLSPIRRALR